MNSPGCGVPMTMIAPTMTIPWIAFVPDISGVCSSVGTFEITSNPTKTASIRIVSSVERQLTVLMRAHTFLSCRGRRTRRASDLVLEVELQLALGARCWTSAATLRA